jgi:hypothetical protein
MLRIRKSTKKSKVSAGDAEAAAAGGARRTGRTPGRRYGGTFRRAYAKANRVGLRRGTHSGERPTPSSPLRHTHAGTLTAWFRRAAPLNNRDLLRVKIFGCFDRSFGISMASLADHKPSSSFLTCSLGIFSSASAMVAPLISPADTGGIQTRAAKTDRAKRVTKPSPVVRFRLSRTTIEAVEYYNVRANNRQTSTRARPTSSCRFSTTVGYAARVSDPEETPLQKRYTSHAAWAVRNNRPEEPARRRSRLGASTVHLVTALTAPREPSPPRVTP